MRGSSERGEGAQEALGQIKDVRVTCREKRGVLGGEVNGSCLWESSFPDHPGGGGLAEQGMNRNPLLPWGSGP